MGDAEIDAELAERAALLDGPARAARAVLANDPDEGWTGDRRAVPEALRRVVARLAAEGPLLLIVDDLHWYGGGYGCRQRRAGPAGERGTSGRVH